MRGKAREQRSLVMVGSMEQRIPESHPIRQVKVLADRALAQMGEVFEAMYAESGRPSVPPERLLKAQVLIALFSVRSDRQFCEQLEYNLLFRWFLDMELDEASFDASTFSRNRERLIRHEVAERFLAAIVEEARKGRLLSSEHFSVDGTLIEAWASMKSFRPKDEPKDGPPSDSNGWSDFKGTKRSNETHASKTDPESRLARKGAGQEAKLAFSGHALMENRNGLLIDLVVAPADGYAERREALALLGKLPGQSRKTVGADKGYDTTGFVAQCRELGVTPHVAENAHRLKRSAIDARTTRHTGYGISQIVRRRIEAIFGWMKVFGGLRRTRVRGVAKTQLQARIAAATYNLLRIARMTAQAA
jgi:transposase